MKKIKGFTLVEIMIVVAIIGLLAAIAIPNFIAARTRAQTTACIANLKQLQGAKTLYGLDNQLSGAGSPVMGVLIPNYIRSTPSCPSGGAYTLNNIDTNPTCTMAAHTCP